jgi:hypothetical protein
MQPQRLLCLSAGRQPSADDILHFAENTASTAGTIVAVGGPSTAELEALSTDSCWFCPDLNRFWARWAEALRRSPVHVASARDERPPSHRRTA